MTHKAFAELLQPMVLFVTTDKDLSEKEGDSAGNMALRADRGEVQYHQCEQAHSTCSQTNVM